MSESSALSRVELLDSVGGCATLCTQLGSDCEGFSSRFYGKDSVETFRGFKCEFSFSNYTNYKTSSSGWYLWEKKTSTSSVRSVTSPSISAPEPECPVVWRQWPSDNATLGVWAPSLSSQEGGNDAGRALDGDEATEAQTSTGHLYPYLVLDLGRSMRVTKLAVLGGQDPALNPIMNLDVRVGNTSYAGTDANGKITGNIRCGTFFGPTLVAGQWIEIDCGFSKGIYGRYVSLQLVERFVQAGGGRLDIAEAEVYGWGRTCARDV